MVGRRKNDRVAPSRIGRIRYGSADKIESMACYLQTRINWRLNFVIQLLLCTLNRLCRLFSSNLIVNKFTTVIALYQDFLKKNFIAFEIILFYYKRIIINN